MPIKLHTITSSAAVVIIISEKNELADTIKMKLQELGCEANILDPKSISNNKNGILPIGNKDVGFSAKPIYLIFIVDWKDPNLKIITSTIERLAKININNLSKILICLPFNQTAEFKKKLNRWNKLSSGLSGLNLVKIYIGDLITNQFNSSAGILDDVISKILSNQNSLLLKQETKLFPLSAIAAANGIIKIQFSMGSLHKAGAILAPPISFNDVLKRLADYKIYPTGKNKIRDIFQTGEVVDPVFVNENMSDLIKKKMEKGDVVKSIKNIKTPYINKLLPNVHDTLSAVSLRIGPAMAVLPDFIPFLKKQGFNSGIDKTPNTNFKVNNRGYFSFIKNIKTLIFLILCIIYFPILSLTLINLSIGISIKHLNNADIQKSTIFIDTASFLSKLSNIYLSEIIKTPVLGEQFIPIYNKLIVADKELLIMHTISESLKDVSSFLSTNKNNTSETGTDYLSGVYLDLNKLYSEVSFLQSENPDSSGNKHFKVFETADFKNKLNLMQSIISERDDLLGSETPKSYLLLLMNNSKIMPIGGKIEALAIIKISDSIITNIDYLTLEDIDKNLYEPAKPEGILRKYFKEDNWKFTNSNVFSDFKLSAQKIEWYLDKSINTPVDGVIALDTKALEAIFTLFGEVEESKQKKPDTNLDYIKTLEYLINSLSDQNSKTKIRILYKIVRLLNEKHILIFLHNNKANNAVGELGWDGSVSNTICDGGCYSDLIGIVETSGDPGGDNLNRGIDINVSFQKNVIKRNLTYYLENNNDHSYSTYIKLLTNSDSGVAPVEVKTPKNKISVYPETVGISNYKESGLFVNFEPKQTKAINFSWESGIGIVNHLDRYKLLFRKQPGLEAFPLKVSLSSLEDIIKSDDDRSLTDKGGVVYNVDLSKDLIFKLDLEKRYE